jgi:hypothetical protein
LFLAIRKIICTQARALVYDARDNDNTVSESSGGQSGGSGTRKVKTREFGMCLALISILRAA